MYLGGLERDPWHEKKRVNTLCCNNNLNDFMFLG